MRQRTRAAIVCSALGWALPGCTGVITQHAITAFSRSVEARNLANLKHYSSERFEEQALRLPESVQDLKLLKLPAGKIKVASIQEPSRNERIVTVEVDGAKAPIEYRLKREPRSGWVVDDVLITQKAGTRDAEVSKSVTEQMNLLLSVRETFSDWQSKDRERVMAAATQELAAELEGLPPAWLDQVTARVAGDGPLRTFHPKVLMQGEKAAVELSRPSGHLLMDFRLRDGRWLLADAALSEGKEDDVRSLRRLCAGLTQSRKFLEAYAAADTSGLQAAITESFQQNCLAEADLKRFPLPVMELLTGPFEVRHQKQRIDVLLEHESTTYTVNVIWPEAKEDQKNEASEAGLSPKVEELTIYDRSQGQVKRLSAMFRAHAIVEYYSQVLAARDAAQLKHLSSAEFNATVWKNFPAEILSQINVPEIEDARPQVLSTVFQGPVTEINVMQGSRMLTYVLHSEAGRLVVDDILMPVLDRPNSFKKHMQLLAPVASFADGIRRRDCAALMAASGSGLDRIVWKQVRDVPEIGVDISRYLTLPVVAMHPGDTQARLTLSDGVHSAEVEFEEEQGRFVIADARFLAGPETRPVAMLQEMRRSNARDMQSRYAQDVLPAAHAEPADTRRLIEPL